MGEFLGFCLLVYVVFGVMFILEVVSRLNKINVEFTKGDIVLAIVYLPFTLVILVGVLLTFIIGITLDHLKFTRLHNWWESPVRNKK